MTFVIINSDHCFNSEMEKILLNVKLNAWKLKTTIYLTQSIPFFIFKSLFLNSVTYKYQFLPSYNLRIHLSWKRIIKCDTDKWTFRFPSLMWQWSTKDWRFHEWLNNTLSNNTKQCKKLPKIVSNRKNGSRELCMNS